jgi:putative aldouronate transport system permease protein
MIHANTNVSKTTNGGRLSFMSFLRTALRIINRDKYLLILIAPAILYYILFHYVPMYGNLIAFVDYRPGTPIFENVVNHWVGFRWFIVFFNSIFFTRLLSNTLILSVLTIIFSFPAPIIFTLLLNEVRHKIFKRSLQTASYMPFFISAVVVVGILFNFVSVTDGLVNNIRAAQGLERIDFMGDPAMFRPLFVGTSVWQSFGWNSIIYLAALSSIDPTLYEAAEIDGANRLKRIWHITLPGLKPVILMLLILTLGRVMSADFQMVLLMQNPATFSTSDIIQTYVYRRGILGGQFSFAAAVGLFNSVINLTLLVSANALARKIFGHSLW